MRVEGLFVFVLNNVDDFLLFGVTGEARLAVCAEGDLARGGGKESMVSADEHVLAGVYLRAALADDDHARARRGTVGELHAEIFWIGIAQVLRRTASFSMCHGV